MKWKMLRRSTFIILITFGICFGEELLEREKRFNPDNAEEKSNSLDAFFDVLQKRSEIPKDEAGSGEGDPSTAEGLDQSYDELMDKYVEAGSGNSNSSKQFEPPLKLKRSEDVETMSITSLAKELAIIDEEDVPGESHDITTSKDKRDIDVERQKRDTGDLGDEQSTRRKREAPKNEELQATKHAKRSEIDSLTSLISNKGVFYDPKSKQIIIKKREKKDELHMQKRDYIPDSDPNADWIMAHQGANDNARKVATHGSKGMHVRSVVESIYDTVDDNTHVYNHNKQDDDHEIVPVTGVWSGLGSRPVFMPEKKTKRDGLAQSAKDSKIEDPAKNNTDGSLSPGFSDGKTIMAYDDVHEVIRRKQKVATPLNASDIMVSTNSSDSDLENIGSGSGEGSLRLERDLKLSNKKNGGTYFKTLSVLYRKNVDEVPKYASEIIKKDFIHVKRSLGDDGYVGCYADYLSPQRDLPVRAGIPFVTPNNCRSACLRTGYYYAGLQYGYLCFCGNTYGKYDPVPESECSNACSGNASISCGGYWRNSVYATAGVAIDSNEGPVPFYLPPKTQDEIEEDKNASQTGNSKSSVAKPSPVGNITKSFVPVNGSVLNPYLRAPPTVSPTQEVQTTPASIGNVTTTSRNQIPTSIAQPTVNQTNQQIPQSAFVNPSLQPMDAATTASVLSDVSQAQVSENGQQAGAVPQTTANTTDDNDKRLVLMHWAYLHPQHQNEIIPTSMPPPTPPLRIEPGTRVFKGEIKMKQNWYDDLLETQSSKYQILAGNIEQGLRNVYSNDSSFLKAEILAFREGLVNHNPNTVHKVIAEFALTFDQNAHSPDARLLDYAERKKTIDDMPVFTKSIKLKEYYFDPSSPVHYFSERQKYTPINGVSPNPVEMASVSNTAMPDARGAYAINNPSIVDSNIPKAGPVPPQESSLFNLQGKSDPLNQHVEKEKNRQQQQQQQEYKAPPQQPQPQQQPPQQQQQQQQVTSDNNVARSSTPNRPVRPSGLQAYQAEGNLEPMTKADAGSKQKRAQPINKPKVPYILRLFFWKDMVARKKRALRDAHLAQVLDERERRNTKRSTTDEDIVSMTTGSNKRSRRMDVTKILRPQIGEKTERGNKGRKVKRSTKEPSDEKELHRSKRSRRT